MNQFNRCIDLVATAFAKAWGQFFASGRVGTPPSFEVVLADHERQLDADGLADLLKALLCEEVRQRRKNDDWSNDNRSDPSEYYNRIEQNPVHRWIANKIPKYRQIIDDVVLGETKMSGSAKTSTGSLHEIQATLEAIIRRLKVICLARNTR